MQSSTQDRPFCRPSCALVCSVTAWGAVLDDRSSAPPAWRVAWCLHELYGPLPDAELRPMLAAVEAAYGVEVVIDGLRKAAGIPAAHGSGVDTDALAALARRYERAMKGAA